MKFLKHPIFVTLLELLAVEVALTVHSYFKEMRDSARDRLKEVEKETGFTFRLYPRDSDYE